MTDQSYPGFVPVEEYLESELTSVRKHEYVGGHVYPLPEYRNQHNLIVGNIQGTLHNQLRGSGCRPYNSDTKIRIRLPNQTRFYYPDTSVICAPNPPDDSFQDNPAAIVEVLSDKTRRQDEGEKREAYFAIPSLLLYLLVEQHEPAVRLFRRTPQGFVPEYYAGLDSVIPLPDLGISLALADIYDSVEFGAEPENE